jgi:squalene-hopene/tetraprenyl-beta-curcumene cyclase
MATGVGVGFDGSGQATSPARTPLAERVAESIERGVAHLLSLQVREGYWLGELEADTTLESDYIYYLHVLGRADAGRIAKLASYVRRRQLSDGGWNIYFGGPAELNATVKAYVALSLAGDAPNAPHMELARRRVHELGGLEKTNSFTRFYLALVGAISWEMAPAVPPELMLLPRWFPVNIWEMSSWTRGIVVPLTILYALKPNFHLPGHLRVDDLLRDPTRKLQAFSWQEPWLSWRNCFLALDRACKLYERLPWQPLRQRAIRQAKEWLLTHLERSEGLAAIYPAMMNAIFALVATGHSPDDPLTQREMRQLERFEIEEKDTIRLQPCFSPVWDTAIAMVALEEAGLPPNHPALLRAADWLLDHQVLGPGDWQEKNPDALPGGWVFEFRNDFYPDVDDTAFVLMALQRVDHPEPERLRAAARRGIDWLVSMQNRDGGWGGFDKDNDRQFLNHIPFADHNAMLDPSSADVTARVLECLGRHGWPISHPVYQRGLAYLSREQAPEGPWYGRWGVNYVYGTSGVLRALETVRLTGREFCQKAAEWLRAVQNPDGGFGESIASYYDPSLKGKGISTPSQTAWGLIGLLAAGWREEPAVTRGIEHLLNRQATDGSWDEPEFTGTGFPCVFYLKYHLYRNYFPLYALARYRNQGMKLEEYRAYQLGPQGPERRAGERESQ